MFRYLIGIEASVNVSTLITSPLFSYCIYRLLMRYADRKILEATGELEPQESNLIIFLKGVGIYLFINLLCFALSKDFHSYINSMNSIQPIIFIICFFRLYFRMGKANYLTITSKVNPDHVKDVTGGEVLGHIAVTQALVSLAMHAHNKNKK